MRWITRAHLHLDRVATPWLIKRFVDPSAEFEFAPWDHTPCEGDGPIPFGFPGVELSSHDERGTSFHKVLVQQRLTDPALVRMDRIVAAGVAHAMGEAPPPGLTDEEVTLSVALDLLGAGFGLVCTDVQHLELGKSFYDAVYALCQVALLPAGTLAEVPQDLAERIAFLRQAIGLSSLDPV